MTQLRDVTINAALIKTTIRRYRGKKKKKQNADVQESILQLHKTACRTHFLSLRPQLFKQSFDDHTKAYS